jgi:hypothetical protein
MFKILSLAPPMRKKLLLVILLSISLNSFSTHLRCGRIHIRQIAPGSKTVEVTVEYYTNIQNTTVLFGGDQDVLDFGDGASQLVPETQNQPPADGEYDSVGYARYSVMHTYSTFGQYIVSYREPNRNEGIINFDNSVNTTAYIESKFTLLTDRAYQSPTPLYSPMFYAYVGSEFTASAAGVDSNNFRLSYQWDIPLMDQNTPVLNYEHPGIILDPVTGLISWDCKFNGADVVGEYLIAMRIKQYDTLDGQWQLIGETFRDYQIILQDQGLLTSSVATSVNDPVFEIPENATATFKVFAYHSLNENAAVSLRTELAPEFYSFETYDSTNAEQHILV